MNTNRDELASILTNCNNLTGADAFMTYAGPVADSLLALNSSITALSENMAAAVTELRKELNATQRELDKQVELIRAELQAGGERQRSIVAEFDRRIDVLEEGRPCGTGGMTAADIVAVLNAARGMG